MFPKRLTAGLTMACSALPTPWFSELHFGAQDPSGDTMVSFLGEGHAHGEEEGSEEEVGPAAFVWVQNPIYSE